MQYDMVFEGGGAKGMVFVGALLELEARGHHPARLLGTSAGSIMAALLAAGYDATEMAEALTEKQPASGQPVFAGFLQMPLPFSQAEIQQSVLHQFLREVNLKFVPDLLEEKLDRAIVSALATTPATSRVFNFIERGGFFAAQSFVDYLENKLNSGVYPGGKGAFPAGSQRAFGSMNLAQFYQATGVDLSLIAADTSASQMLILNHRTAPGCPVVRAVRMSMSVPLLWDEVVWQPEWGQYRGQEIAGHAIVDGGLLSNFPIELFLSNQPQVAAVMGEKTVGDAQVLGFLIDEKLEVPGAPAIPAQARAIDPGSLRTVSRLSNLLNTMLSAHDKSVIEAFERFVIHLPAKSYGTIEFEMSDARRQALVNAGRQATIAYFERPEPPASALPPGILAPESVTSVADRVALERLFP